MNWVQGLTKAIAYIETNLTNELTVNDVASHVYASGAHYQRVFSLATGITIGDYIRNRRLSMAGQDLLQTDIRIIEIITSSLIQPMQGVFKNQKGYSIFSIKKSRFGKFCLPLRDLHFDNYA